MRNRFATEINGDRAAGMELEDKWGQSSGMKN
jgi:hypothetical protein